MFVPCLYCYTAVRVIDDPLQIDALVGKNSEFWPNNYDCISCGKKCEALSENDVDPDALIRFKIRDLKAEEYYAALMGLGTPDEMICDAATVRELLSKPIKRVVGYTIPNTTRFLLEEIEVEGGIKLHFGAGALGAVVYRITRPISYTERVLNND